MPALPKNQFEILSSQTAIKLVRHCKWAKLYISEFNMLPHPFVTPDNRIARISFRENSDVGDLIEDMLCAIPILRALGFNIVMLSEIGDCPYEMMRFDEPNPNKLPATGPKIQVTIWKDAIKAIDKKTAENVPLTAYDATVAVPNDCFEYIMDLLDSPKSNSDAFEIVINECPGTYIDAVATIPKLMTLGLFIPVIEVHPDCMYIESFVVSTSPCWKKMYVI